MRMRSMAIIVTPLIALGFARAASAQQASVKASGNVRSAIETANTGFIAALKAGDAVKAAAIYTDDAVVYAPGAPAMRGREAIAAGFGGWLSQDNVTQFTLNSEEVVVSGDYAFESGTYTMATQPKSGGDAQTDSGKYLTVWKRQSDGSWKLHRDAWNSDKGM